MNLDRPNIYLERFSSNTDNKNVSGKIIHSCDLSDANKEFIDWTKSTDNNSIRMVSFNYPCSITLTMYSASLSTTNKSSIACTMILGNVRSEVTYKLNSDDFESIADIVPMVIKISSGDITHFSDQKMVALFNALMEKIGTKV